VDQPGAPTLSLLIPTSLIAVLDASAARILLLLVRPKPSALLTTTWLASTLLLLAKILAAGTLLALSLPIVMLLLVHETARVLESSHPTIPP
jgi:hypothetical protein